MITENDIRGIVSHTAFRAGQLYLLEGRVRGVKSTVDGSLIEATVRGTKATPYKQRISVTQRRDSGAKITGTCTCPVGFNCKHVAAALLAFRTQPSRAEVPAEPPAIPSESPLPPDVGAWLRRLQAAQEPETEDYPPTVRKRLLFVLGASDGYGASPAIELASIEIDATGASRDTGKRYSSAVLLQGAQPPKFLRPSDRSILRRLGSLGRQGEEFIATLRLILATGRGRWRAWDGATLAEGPPIPATLAWTLAEDGRQKPDVALPPNLMTLGTDIPWYVDPATGTTGPVETGLPAAVVQAMLASPWLPPDLAGRVRQEIARRVPAHRLAGPAEIGDAEPFKAKLQPGLRLLAGEIPRYPAHASGFWHRSRSMSAQPGTRREKLVRMSWNYGPVSLKLDDKREVVVHKGRLLRVVRDKAAETKALRQMMALGFRKTSQIGSVTMSHPHASDLMPMDEPDDTWLDFMLDELPALRSRGWRVDIDDDFPLRLALPDGNISIEIAEGSGIDWFDLDLGVMVDGARVSLLPALLDVVSRLDLALLRDPDEAAFADAPPLTVRLPDGRLLAVPFDRLPRILAPLLELLAGGEFDQGAGLVRIARRNAADLAALEAASEGAGIAWTGGDAVRSLGRQLREHGRIPASPTPQGFGATLRPYQEHGLAWLQFLASAGLGGILADDMGLGKTVQTLAHLCVDQAAGRLAQPALIVCPTSLVANWRAEAARFAPSLRVLVLHGPARAQSFGAIAEHDLIVTTYPLLARDQAVLVAQDWHAVVLDEAQTIKNPLATTSRLARTLQARQRLCLSGTPLENHLGELWSLFDFLMPGFLGDRKGFAKLYRTPIEKGGDTERQTQLARRVAPFLLRRTKREVAADLPPKTTIAEMVDMADAQRALYEGIRLSMHAKVRAAIAARGLASSGIVILDALLKLRQACCDPRLLKLATAKAARAGSAKLDRLIELIEPMLEDGRRILLFSQFTSMLALIQAELDHRAWPYLLLTGETKDRATPVGRFQRGEVPLFLISLKAGGVGLNLTAADTVIHYDPWWNPAVEDQATDRAHRIGQDKPVFVHRLITAGTIEEKMETLKQRKQALADGILAASTEAAVGLTETDLDILFEPFA